MSFENPSFLRKKYDLHNASEVDSAVKREEVRTGEKVNQDSDQRIQIYLDRFKEIIERKEPAKRERGIEALKKVLHDKFIIKPENIPEAYFANQQRLAREQGHGDIEITDEMREQLAEVIIADQKASLNQWIDYLSSGDAVYPDWLKYYAFRSIIGMGEYDKEKKQFTKRSAGTVKPFPDINREALAYVLDAIEKKYQDNISNNDPEFQKLLQGENFTKLYAWAIDKVTSTTESDPTEVKGEWVKYRQGRDHMPLVESLQGYGTGWCTAGESTAKAQLANGDFYVYYSLDKNGKPNIPRAAIRMEGENIGEVRGIGPDQNLDPYIGEVVKEKLKEFSDGQAYEKKSADMKYLTEIEKKTKAGQNLTKEDLVFLYEINYQIEGFGYQRDPRIQEIIKTRNVEEDMPTVFDCEPNQIAHNQSEITENTRAYVGKLFPNIFQKSIEHIYTSFPKGEIQKYQTEIGGKSKDQIKQELKENNIYVSEWAGDLLEKMEIQKNPENIDLIRLTVRDLGFPEGATTDEIYKSGEELGLELCPAEAGPRHRLKYLGHDYMNIAGEQVTGRIGIPSVFSLHWAGEQLKLYGSLAEPGSRWDADDNFVFCLRKKS